MSHQTIKECPVCGAPPDATVPYHRTGYLVCLECNLVLTDRSLDTDAIAHHYESVDPVNDVSQSRLDIYRRFLKSAQTRLGHAKKLLDVGCGSGAFIDLAGKMGWQSYGVEPVETLAGEARRCGLNVATGILDQMPREWGPFDLITYWDSFMLVENPAEEMGRILTHLEEDGWIFLRLRQHGFQRLLYRCWKVCGHPLRLPDPSVYHPYNFFPGTIRKLAGRFNMSAGISNAPYTAGDPYSTMRQEKLVVILKWFSDFTARAAYAISRGKWIASPGMDIWLHRRNTYDTG